jgi:hypothetical protein
MTASLMGYVPGAVVISFDTLLAPDWTNNRFYSAKTAGGAAAGISQITGYLSGDVTAAKTIGAIGIVGISDRPLCVTYSGHLAGCTNISSNSVQMALLCACDLSLVSTFGTVSASTSPSTDKRILSPGAIAPLRAGQTDFVITTPFAFNKGEVCILTIPGFTNLNLGNTVETGVAALGRGAVNATTGTAYVLGRGVNVFSLYKVSVTSGGVPSFTGALHTFAPANIDATWATFSVMSGVAYDQTDGNVLVGVQTTDVVAVQSYVCKLNGTTGALMWKCAVDYTSSGADNHFRYASIKNGRFYTWSPNLNSTLTTLNTIAGTATTQVVSHMNTPTMSGSEDTNDSIVAAATWTEGTTFPNYIGTYMGTLGNHTLSGWMRLFPNGPTLPLPSAPPAQCSCAAGSTDGAAVVSSNRAWSYTLDGHTFYVLDLGAQGTFVFDVITQQWSQFVTGTPATGYGSLSPQWTMQNGCMWGTRIVAGDLATPTIWEMTPGAVLDNDATQIAHVCTGAVTSRSRDYTGCDSLQITASFGFLDSTGAVDFKLRYSDDSEHSWSTYDIVSLTPGNFGDEIAWRSLGSFNSPGRIFELSDVGGLIRIDGADVSLTPPATTQQGEAGS